MIVLFFLQCPQKLHLGAHLEWVEAREKLVVGLYLGDVTACKPVFACSLRCLTQA